MKKKTVSALAVLLVLCLLPPCAAAWAGGEPENDAAGDEPLPMDAPSEEPITLFSPEYEELLPLDGDTVFTINGVEISKTSSSITGNCYTYAMEIYRKIWGVGFTGASGSSNDMLRSITSVEGHKLTVENVKNYISAAALGAVIRLTNSDNVFSASNGTGHSQLLVQKDENGFTLLESNVTGGRREKYWTWAEYVQWWAVNTANRGYFQYIEWPGAPAYNGPVEAEECICIEVYAGYYTCTAASALMIRSGHGTSYSILGSIPGGAEVYVSKSDGLWAHVEYNGVTGYASMSYLEKVPTAGDLNGDDRISELDAVIYLRNDMPYPAALTLQKTVGL